MRKGTSNPMRLNLLMIVCCLSIFITACSVDDKNSVNESLNENVSDIETESINNEFGLTIDNTYYAIPCEMSVLLNAGWNISPKTPYFDPIASDDYYEMKSTLSLTDDGESIIAGGDVIKLLEKEDLILEVRIANLDDFENEPKKIEDCTVIAISAIYGDTAMSIMLNGIELNEWTTDALLTAFSGDEEWQHIPTNFSDHPEFNVSLEYDVMRYNDTSTQEITIYFNLDNIPFVIAVTNKIKNDSH